MPPPPTTVAEYLAALPADRRQAIQAVRTVILDNLPQGYEEGIQYGMIAWYVPHSVYPPGYHCDPSQPVPFVSLASHKNHMAIYLMPLYAEPEALQWFRSAWTGAGHRLDMGKSCVRFRRIEDVPLDVVGQAIARFPVRKYLALYESTRTAPRTSRSARSSRRTPAPSPGARATSRPRKPRTRSATAKKPRPQKN